MKRPGVVLKPGPSSGYPYVVLRRRGGGKPVHQLVARAFIGERPLGYDVRHKNGIRSDARAVNLEYGTRKDNIEDMRKHGTLQKRYLKRRNISPQQAIHVRMLNKIAGLSVADISRAFNFPYGSTLKAARNKYGSDIRF
jgi:ABC-type phosphonate transport system ATPase subunit